MILDMPMVRTNVNTVYSLSGVPRQLYPTNDFRRPLRMATPMYSIIANYYVRSNLLLKAGASADLRG